MAKLKKYLALITIIVFSSFLYFLFLWSPSPKWDDSPETRIIAIELVWMEVDYSYIPDVQIWGDGRIIWVEYLPDGERRVFEGKLSEVEMRNVIQKLIDVDFFNIARSLLYKSNSGDYLSAKLQSKYHSERLDSENVELYGFANYLRNGAGLDGVEIIPIVARLYAFLIEDTGLPNDTNPLFYWKDDKFGYTLETIRNNSDGLDIAGEQLHFAWKIVNSSKQIVESDGKIYWIAVVVPDL